MHLIYITNIPEHALCAEAAGVDSIMVDLEIIGKDQRQGHLHTVISRHKPDDISTLRPMLKNAKLMVRVNPLYDGTAAEIEDCLERGADRLMLPMFSDHETVARFIDLVKGRAEVVALLETPAAFARLPEILSLEGLDTLHFGLNDLHIGLKIDFMFELFSGGLMDYATTLCKNAGQSFGIGGVARLGQGLLPAEMILKEHVRLGSDQVILSRDFQKLFEYPNRNNLWAREVTKLRQYIETLPTPCSQNAPSEEFCRIVHEIRAKIRSRRSPF